MEKFGWNSDGKVPGVLDSVNTNTPDATTFTPTTTFTPITSFTSTSTTTSNLGVGSPGPKFKVHSPNTPTSSVPIPVGKRKDRINGKYHVKEKSKKFMLSSSSSSTMLNSKGKRGNEKVGVDPVHHQPTPLFPQISKFTPREIAEELTRVDREFLSKISEEEMFRLKWTKNPKSAPYLDCAVTRWNGVSDWLVSEIISAPTSPERMERAQLSIAVAQELYELNNFHGLMAFVAAWNRSIVEKIAKQLWKNDRMNGVRTKLSLLMSTEQNFSKYRAKLKKRTGSSVLPGTSCITPYLGILMKDLVANNEGGYRDTQTGLFNCAKLQCLRQIYAEFNNYASVVDVSLNVLEGEEPLKNVLDTLYVRSEDELWDLVHISFD
eukprot:TRINITY_DN8201_c0_g1_i3.p1 TRINITY_DN8201_c0_g1~~TRINITY_DN8201_c0_g1_i3.p1  ORF type:complete len:378 (+),score=97.56 TRINITY_DN8201_c0_g1_i3:458-1591(+)